MTPDTLATGINTFGSTTFTSLPGFLCLAGLMIFVILWAGFGTIRKPNPAEHPALQAYDHVGNGGSCLIIAAGIIGLLVLFAGAFGLSIPELLK